MDEELNPFLGHRALRLCLERTDLFKTQLRSLLRASIYGDLHIMFPMVATLNEVRQAKALLKECETELKEEGYQVSDNYKVGIMVEIPAVAILADQFAKEVDFFSIGTNDLIQYSFAADRMNQKVSYLYQPYNPSLLRLIKMVIDASHKEGIWTGMCGEMAGDQIAAPILLGLGLDEFSMSATSILQTRHLFSKLNYNEMKKMAEKVLTFGTNEEVQDYVNKTIKGE
jgi:phosphotransferase system enzyme I (PtsI)